MNAWKTRLAFGSPDLALSLLFATVNGWFLYYLVTIIGLPPLLAGAAFVFGRVLDGLLDPLIGAWADRHRRKPVIALSLPFAAAGFVALWIVPALLPDARAAAGATAAVFAGFALAYTGVSVPRLAMMPTVVPGYDARTGQASVDMGFVFVAVLIASTAFPGVVAALGTGGALAASGPRVWMLVACGIAVLAVLAYLPFLFFIREPVRPSATGPRPGLRTVLAGLAGLRRSPGALATLLLFAGTVLTLVSLQSILPFWLDRGPGLSAGGQSLVLLTVFACTIGSLPFWAALARRLCKLRCLMTGICVTLAGLAIAMTLAPGSAGTPGLYLSAALAGGGAGALSMCPWAMIPDIAEAHTRRLGAAAEGIASAAFTMTNKLAAATALLLNALALAAMDRHGLAGSAPWAHLSLPAALAGGTLVIAAALYGLQPGLSRRAPDPTR